MAPFCQENQLLSVSKPSECPKGAHHLTMRHSNFTHCRPFSTGSRQHTNTHARTPKNHTDTLSIKIDMKVKISARRERLTLNVVNAIHHLKIQQRNKQLFLTGTKRLNYIPRAFMFLQNTKISATSTVTYQERESRAHYSSWNYTIYRHTCQKMSDQNSLNCIFQLIFNQCWTVSQRLTEWPLSTTDRVSFLRLSVFLPRLTHTHTHANR